MFYEGLCAFASTLFLPLALAVPSAAQQKGASEAAGTRALSVQEKEPWSLQYAAAHHQLNTISMLITLGVDVNAQGSNGNRALDISCLNGDAATTRVLLEHGANPNLRNQDGSTPLHDAALKGNRELIELLLMHGAGINAVDSESASTPLHLAASFGRLDAVKALVEHGADPSLKNREGLTALALAAKNNFADVVRFLSGKKL
jgi:ankyrin repeat protein